MLSDFSYPSSPGWFRLAAAAKLAGMSAELLAKGIDTGQIPVRLQRIGNWRFVSCADLQAWMRATKSPTVDLFGGITA